MSYKIDRQNFWLNIDKPEGCSSAKIVSIVKKITKSKRVGHAGTLDPFATGVLPIAVGRATKTCEYVVGAVKKYYFEIAWGSFTDSDDKTGSVIQTSDLRPTTLEIINSLSKFIGTISQVPSSFSAIKVNGQKSYDLARKGVAVPLKSRLVTIYKIKLIFNNQTSAGFEITCSKGTYVRSFAKDLSLAIGVCGFVTVLRRLQVGTFLSRDSISLAKLKNIVNYGAPNNSLLQLRDVLNFIPEIELNTLEAFKLKNGQFVDLSDTDGLSQNIQVVKIISEGVLIALASLKNSLLKHLIIF